MSIKFTTLASGSRGNSVYIGTDNTKILIDAGISGTKVKQALRDINVSLDDIDAVFVTHEHLDHINGIGVISRKYNIPIYATEGTWYNMSQKIGKISNDNKRLVYKNEGILLNDIFIHSFAVPHDAVDPVCYNILYDGIKICVATDMGHITKSLIENIRDCSALVLESNHDINMLKASDYPSHLKKRILGKYGHISNETCAKLLACVMNNKLKNVFLAHLSSENNTPDLAYLTVSNILEEYGIQAEKDVNLHIAKPYGITELIEIKQ